MTDVERLMMELSLALHDADLCARRLRQSTVDPDQLLAHADQLYGNVIRLIAHVMQIAGVPASSLFAGPDARGSGDDMHDRRDLIAAVQAVYGFATFVRHHITVDQREYDVLAEYADGLHDELTRLMAVLTTMGVLPAANDRLPREGCCPS